jgi:CHASE2 domain-containing sensor protein
MNEPLGSIPAALGLKYATLVAGFAGGVVSLSYVKELTRMQAGVAVLTGTFSAGYLTPWAAQYLDVSAALENSLAFGIGLTAINVVPGIIRMSERFRDDPLWFFRKEGK